MIPRNICLLVLLSSMVHILTMSAQTEAYLQISNESINAGEVTFDIFLSVPTGATSEHFLLGNADFVINFDAGVFDQPAITKVAPGPEGLCTFLPEDTNGSNILITRINYHDRTMVNVIDNKIIINLQGPSPDQQTILTRVARIDHDSTAHRLGQFQLSGLLNDQANPQLRWKTNGDRQNTKVFALEDSDPFLSIPVTITTNRPDCPEFITINYPMTSSANHHAQSILEISSTIDGGSQISLHAGDEVVLHPGFSITTGSTLTIQMDGCP